MKKKARLRYRSEPGRTRVARRSLVNIDKLAEIYHLHSIRLSEGHPATGVHDREARKGSPV
jgi:hypothetical protein